MTGGAPQTLRDEFDDEWCFDDGSRIFCATLEASLFVVALADGRELATIHVREDVVITDHAGAYLGSYSTASLVRRRRPGLDVHGFPHERRRPRLQVQLEHHPQDRRLRDPARQADRPALPGGLTVMRADGTDVTSRTDDAADDVSPVWAPDGTALSFVSTRGGDADIYL